MSTLLTRLFLILAVCIAMWADLARAETESLLAKTQQFAFYSDFQTNLHDALVVAGSRASGDDQKHYFGDQVSCLEGLSPSSRQGWESAVSFYEQVVSPYDWADRQVMLMRQYLSGNSGHFDEREQAYVDQVMNFVSAAGHAYRACLWPARDEENRQWLDRLLPKLVQHESEIASRLQRHFATPWHGLPIRVDLVRDAPPLGANSIFFSPEGGHLQVSMNVLEKHALEIVFHESAHTVNSTWRKDPLPMAMIDEAARQSVELPRDFWHVVMFWVTGKTIEQVLADAGEGYLMYMEDKDLWAGRWGPYRAAIESVMPAYLAGEISLESAANKVVAHLAESAQ